MANLIVFVVCVPSLIVAMLVKNGQSFNIDEATERIEKFETEANKLDKFDKYCTENIFIPLMRAHVYRDPEIKQYEVITSEFFNVYRRVLHKKFIANLEPIEGVEDAKIIYETLGGLLLAEDPKQRFVKDFLTVSSGLRKSVELKNKVEQIFQTYLIEPCKQYISLIGNLIPPEDLVQKFEEGGCKKIDSGEMIEFYYGLARYRMCKRLIENHVSLLDQVKDVATRKLSDDDDE